MPDERRPIDVFFDEFDPEKPMAEWQRMFAFCGQCWLKRLLWVKGNVGYCDECRPDWRPTHSDGKEAGDG